MKQQAEILQVVAHLNAAITNTRLYAADHPQVLRNLERAHGQLLDLLRQQPEMTLIIVDDEVLVDHHVLSDRTPQLDQLIEWFRQSAIERITFTQRVTMGELARFVGELISGDDQGVHSSQGIKLGKVKILPGQALAQQADGFTEETKQRLQELALVRNRSLDELKGLYHTIHQTKDISAKGVGAVVQGFLSGMLRNVNPLHMLASLKSSDEYTFTHAINVCLLTMAQAESFGISGRQLYDVGVTGALHDAGKMFVPDEILNKPGKLTDDEWVHMRDHALRGSQYLLRLEGLPKLVFLGALEHHIRYDGSGYPDLGKHWRPNLVSQMIAVADMFDAMRSRRPYKEPKPDDFIFDILQKESGTAFNPIVVDNFLRMLKA